MRFRAVLAALWTLYTVLWRVAGSRELLPAAVPRCHYENIWAAVQGWHCYSFNGIRFFLSQHPSSDAPLWRTWFRTLQWWRKVGKDGRRRRKSPASWRDMTWPPAASAAMVELLDRCCYKKENNVCKISLFFAWIDALTRSPSFIQASLK